MSHNQGRFSNDRNEQFSATCGFAQAVRSGIDANFINAASSFGEAIKSVSTSQIRNIFGSIKKMEMEADFDFARFLMLKPRVAYARKREGKKEFGAMADEITRAIDAVSEEKDETKRQERFRRFCQGFEAILAYHRAAGGK